jgi:hypothetical protein
MSALSNQPYIPAPNYNCTGPQCVIDDVNILGVCSTCKTEPMTIESFDSCNMVDFKQYWNTGEDADFYKVNNYQEMHDLLIQFPELSSQDPAKDYEVFVVDMDCEKKYPDTAAISIRLRSQAIRGSLQQSGGVYGTMQEYSFIQKLDSDPLRYCIYNTSLSDNLSPRFATATCFSSTTDLSLYSNMQYFGQINGTVTNCDLQFCEYHYDNVSIINGQKSYNGLKQNTLKAKPGPGYDPETLNQDLDWTSDSNGGSNYPINYNSRNGLARVLNQTANSEDITVRADVNDPGLLGDGSSLNNITLLFERFANTMTSVIQSTANPNGHDNIMKVYDYEVFVHVQWQFMILPFIIVFLAYLFLALTIFESRKKRYLLKTSILAAMFHGLDPRDWKNVDEHGAVVGTTGISTDGELVKRAEKIEVVFYQYDDGMRRLRKE